MPILATFAAAAVALPVIAQADHRPGHSKPDKPPAGGDLTIAAQPDLTVFRGSTVISGSLKGPDNAGKTVILREDEFPYAVGIKDVATTTTNAKGDYTFTRNPARNTAYRAVVGATVSPNVIVKVRIRIGLRVSDATPRVGQIVRLRGRACPSHVGLPVRIQRRTSTGSFRTVRSTTLRTGTGGCSVYTRRLRVFRDGVYRVTADDADHARGFSTPRFINTPR